ncbi:MAG TPA: hydrogenase expression/formation protein HypE [Burkholderiaceae bacterium]|nr:hydrogenase expression/formation protein HypE [Burkholderiaceae bacterium]
MNDQAAAKDLPRVENERRRARVLDATINLAHGGGGRAMRTLIEDVFVSAFDNPLLAPLEDQAVVPLASLLDRGDRLAFTTDSYVVDPLFFPGGDIGTLAVNGTVNDLAMSGAVPLFLSCGMVLEEGLAVDALRRIADSMRRAAAAARVQIVTGDTKVVGRGAADKVFINTAGIGVVPRGVAVSASAARAGDVVVINGSVGDHGAAILVARGQLALQADLASDCQPLADLVATMLATGADIRCLRDATRGGVATVVNEFARSSGVCIHLDETALPLRAEVRGACEILGLDPLYLANEGKLVAVVAATDAERLVAAMRQHPAGRQTAVIGGVTEAPRETVILHTGFGGERIVDMLVGEQLPRIC